MSTSGPGHTRGEEAAREVRAQHMATVEPGTGKGHQDDLQNAQPFLRDLQKFWDRESANGGLPAAIWDEGSDQRGCGPKGWRS